MYWMGADQAQSGVPTPRKLMQAALLAIVLPTLVSYNGLPSPRAWQQISAFVGWGIFCTELAKLLQGSVLVRSTGRLRWVFAALGLLAVGAWMAPLRNGMPPYFALATCGFLGACALCLGLGALAQRAGLGEVVFRRFCKALVVAAACGVLIGAVQFFLPEWTDTLFIAHSGSEGRIGGNLRQPNLLCSLILMALMALVWLVDPPGRTTYSTPRWTDPTALALVVFLGAGAAPTLSRSGAVILGLLFGWVMLDRGFGRRAKLAVGAFAATFYVVWPNVFAWQPMEAHARRAIVEVREEFVASIRIDLWSQCIELIRQYPLAGVGWGEFNLAWTLTALKRWVLHYPDHAHNLEVHLAVELGLPLALLVCALLIMCLVSAARALVAAVEPDRGVARAALTMVLVMVAHSQLEFPLWVACMLLPTAFALGLALGARRADAGRESAPISRRLGQGLAAGAVLLTLGGLWGAVDFARTMRVSTAGAEASEAARGILFYRLHADRVVEETLGQPLAARDFSRASHLAPLLPSEITAWAQQLADRGETDKARYLVQRAREWRRLGPPSEFFAPCAHEAAAPGMPFQCAPPAGDWAFEDFLRP